MKNDVIDTFRHRILRKWNNFIKKQTKKKVLAAYTRVFADPPKWIEEAEELRKELEQTPHKPSAHSQEWNEAWRRCAPAVPSLVPINKI